MSYSKDEFDEVLKMTREIPQTQEEIILREFGDMKSILQELKELLKE